jgi:NarL family two-component system sensor histidine kinase LiaS
MRFRAVKFVAENWSNGDFSRLTQDRSDDELGQLARQLNVMAKKLEIQFQEQQRLAILEERNRLARELHDSLKQQLFAISMQIWGTMDTINQKHERLRERLQAIDQQIQQAQQELSALIYQLRPVALADKPFEEALEHYCQQWSQQYAIPVDLNQEPLSISFKGEEALFRVAQEALANIARHSRATQATIKIVNYPDRLEMIIEDNGKGFEREHASFGIGLQSMRERMEVLGSRLEISSTLNSGTTVHAIYKKGSLK